MSADVFAFDEEGPSRVLCLFRWGNAYKLGGLGAADPGQNWKLVAKFALGLPGRLTEDGGLYVEKGPHGHRLSPEGVALIGPEGWFGLRPLGSAKPSIGTLASRPRRLAPSPSTADTPERPR